MHKINFIKIALTLIAFLPVIVFAQIPMNRPSGEMSETEKTQEKEIEPLIKKWELEGFGAFKDSVKLDTTLDYFHIYHPVYKDALTATYVGNYGTPYLNNNFFNRSSNIDFYFLETREAYLLTPQKVKYYNTRTPYTMLDFSQSEHRTRKNETRFNVLHSQNVNPYLNFTFRYDQARSNGQYNNQETKNNFVTLYSNYNKDQLSIHAGFITNSIHNNENGGLVSDDLILSDDDTDLLEVNLQDTRSNFGSNYFFATGQYRIGKFIETGEERVIEAEEGEPEKVIPITRFKPVVGFMYSFEYQTHLKEFIENEDTTTFFRNTYYGSDYSKDSIRFRMIQNVLQIKQYENPDRKTSFGKRAFLGQQHVVNSFPGPREGLSFHQRKPYSNIYAGGGIFRETGSFWRWNFEGKIYVLGRRSGQTELSGVITKPLGILNDSLSSLQIDGKIENRVPAYFQQEFYSNHSQWRNNLSMEQRMTAKGSFKSPLRNLELGFNYSLINNFIYNDTLGVPSQFDGQLLVLGAYLDKDFNYRGLHFRTRLLWQKASNDDVLHLPDFSAFVSAYYSFVISKVMFTTIGVDTRYNTAYYADAYDVSTGLFHLQHDKKLGNFPYIDAHVNLRLKRTRVFFKMMNIGTEFINKEYFTTPHYPMNRMTFRMGVAWAFYD
jgi:hypothetical protein